MAWRRFARRVPVFPALLGVLVSLAAAPHPAGGWTREAPPGPHRLDLSASAGGVDLGNEVEARVRAEFDGFAQFSALIRVRVGGGAQGWVHVFDTHGSLVEIVPTDGLADGAFWTAPMEGDAVTAVLVVPGTPETRIVAEGIVGTRDGTRPDGAPDGRFDLDFVENVPPSTFWAQAVDAVATISIGRNPEPFPSGTRPACSVPCTGFMVSADLLMTAGHCIDGITARCRQTVAVFGLKIAGDAARARNCRRLVYYNAGLDIAILRLAASPAPVATIPLVPAPDSPGEAVCG